MATTPDIEFERGLPASLDAERTILGAILLDNQAYSEAATRLRPEDFALTAHQRVYARMGELIDRNHVVDIVTLAEELSRRKEIESVGGVAWLASLTEGLPRRITIEEYVRIVKDKSLLRQLINICSTAITRAADQSEEALEVLNAAETSLLEVTEKGITRGFTSLHEIVAGSFKSIDNLYAQGQHQVTGLRTFLTKFDDMTAGLQNSELIIIAARPSMGKSALAINLAQNAAIKGGKVVAVFSLEMSKESLLRRMLASEAHVGAKLIQTGFIPRDEREKLTNALERLVEARIFIDDTPGISLTEMRAKARRLRQSAGALDLIVVDYLQLMTAGSFGGPEGRRYENRTQEVSAISRGLKALAKELEIPVVALSQLSRASEQRGGDRKPILSDLRESGSIEQDADVVAFIHRESYYNREDPDLEHKAEIIIAKQRNGPTGSIDVGWVSDYTLFADLDEYPGQDAGGDY
ncbi:MAG TPA: replicative DNA helicase [Acidobacteriaceae bacterium]|nr:replicative DNA helicase [Acidobacteriaceae bacterium]